MKLSELLNFENISIQNAFLLGMIYEWPIFLNNYSKILAYSSYKVGKKSKIFLNDSGMSMDKYYIKHLEKLKQFLGCGDNVFLNSYIKNNGNIVDNGKIIGPGVSVLIDYDINIPLGIDSEVYLYGLIEKWLIDVSYEIKDFFLLGFMDARGSLDFSGKLFSIDIAKKEKPEFVKRKINKFNDIIGAIFNFNPRLTQANSDKKNDQFRIKLKYYIGKYGLFTPYKIDYYKSEFRNYSEKIKNEYFFIDENYKNESISFSNKDRNLKINELAINLSKKNLTQEEKKIIINEYKISNLTVDNDDEIEYSSQNMKEFAKKQANYICEYNGEHKTFIAKSINQNYIEAHHLIPFSERKRFDVSIDVVENIICLCPNCHRKIHLAIDEEKINLIKPLLIAKIEKLHNIGIDINESKLLKFYKVNI